MKSIFFVIILLFSIASHAQFLEPSPKSDVYKSINAYRIENGLQPLQVSKKLERSSGRYAWRLNWFHVNEKHDKIWLKTHEVHGELIGSSYNPIQEWKVSYAHNLLILSKRFTYMGVGKSGDVYILRLK